MKKIFTIVCFLALSYLEASTSLNHLIDSDKTTSLGQLEMASDAQLWDVFLEGQAALFFDSEFTWIAKGSRILYFNHSLLFLTLLHRTYHISVDLNRAYDELQDYLYDENAWTSPGTHFLVLKKKDTRI
jgi:hypothetical protein